jgi:quinol monooxygenase YgiN
MICIAVTYLIQPGHEDEAADFFRILTKETLKEPGCRMYVAHRSLADPRKFFLYEQYDDHDAVDAHRASPHFAKYAGGGLFAIVESRAPELYETLTN